MELLCTLKKQNMMILKCRAGYGMLSEEINGRAIGHCNQNCLSRNKLKKYISLDTLLKENSKMVQSMDKERVMGIIKHEKLKSDKKVFQYIEQLKNIDMN